MNIRAFPRISQRATVLAETSKVSETRNVPIEDNLYAWLSAHKGEHKGYVCGFDMSLVEEPAKAGKEKTYKPKDESKFRKAKQALHADMGYRVNGKNKDAEAWEADTFRHSYASYWLAKHKDRAHLAENMGNTVKVIKKHYKAVVSNSAMVAYWNNTIPEAIAGALAADAVATGR